MNLLRRHRQPLVTPRSALLRAALPFLFTLQSAPAALAFTPLRTLFVSTCAFQGFASRARRPPASPFTPPIRPAPARRGFYFAMTKPSNEDLPFDPTTGALDQKIPLPLDTSRLLDVSKVPTDMTPVVLVACGSYSPPTVMHMRIFETARDHFVSMKEVMKREVIGGFVSPVHAAYGKKGLAPAEDRVEMVRLALADSEWINVDSWETKQNEWTRTRLSLDRMQIEVDKVTGDRKAEVMLLCGADILESMVTPGVWMESDLHLILGRGIVAIKRSGSDPEKLIQEHEVLYQYRHKIHLVREWVENNVSSTAVRRACKRGMSIKYLVSDGVKKFIEKKKLYQK